MASWSKIVTRISETRRTKLYVAVACLQAIIIIILQCFIAVENTNEINPLQDAPVTATYSENSQSIALDRFTRIKWENIAFIGFQAWFLGMVFDATINQNSAEIVALAVLNVICALVGAMEIVDGAKWLSLIQSYGIDVTPLSIAEKTEIALTVIILVFAAVFVYLSYEMYRQFGWNIYKKLGADLSLRAMYRWVQFFVLTLKINVFTHFIVSLFYVIQYGFQHGFIHISNELQKEWWFQIAVTILIIPTLWFARDAVSRESRLGMRIVLVFQVVLVVHFSLIFHQTLQASNNWYFWICLLWLGIIMAIATFVEGVIVLRNFGKGLMPHVQRGSRKRAQQQHDLEMNKNAEKNQEDWVIE